MRVKRYAPPAPENLEATSAKQRIIAAQQPAAIAQAARLIQPSRSARGPGRKNTLDPMMPFRTSPARLQRPRDRTSSGRVRVSRAALSTAPLPNNDVHGPAKGSQFVAAPIVTICPNNTPMTRAAPSAQTVALCSAIATSGRRFSCHSFDHVSFLFMSDSEHLRESVARAILTHLLHEAPCVHRLFGAGC
jgi:hypothetical protein